MNEYLVYYTVNEVEVSIEVWADNPAEAWVGVQEINSIRSRLNNANIELVGVEQV